MQTRDLSALPGTIRAWRNRLIQDGMPLLIAAAIVVGIAIGLDGDIRKLVNGVGGILWLVAAFFIVRGTVAAGATFQQIAVAIGIILVLSSLIRPSDPLLAAIGFGWGGVAVGWIGRDLGSKLGALLGALWLPAHLLIAVASAAIRELQDKQATLRSDPPPTAVLVPLIMVLAAWLFAALTQDWRAKRDRELNTHSN